MTTGPLNYGGPNPTPPPAGFRRFWDRHGPRTLIEAFVLLAAVAFVLPVLLIYVESFKPDAEIVRFESVLPKRPAQGYEENFKYILTTPEEIPIFRWLGNSFFISTSATLLVLLVDSLAADGLARLELPGKK